MFLQIVLLVQRGKEHKDAPTFRGWLFFDFAYVREDFGKLLHYFHTLRCVGLLTTAHTDACLNLVALLQKLACNVGFGVEVANINGHAEPNFLDFDNLLIASHFLFFFVLLVLVLAVVHDTAYGRIGVVTDFDKVKSCVVCHALRFVSRHNTELCTVTTDKANFTISDLTVGLKFFDSSILRKQKIVWQAKVTTHNTPILLGNPYCLTVERTCPHGEKRYFYLIARIYYHIAPSLSNVFTNFS